MSKDKFVIAPDFTATKVIDKITEDLPTGLYMIDFGASTEDFPVGGFPLLHINDAGYDDACNPSISIILTGQQLFLTDHQTPGWATMPWEMWNY